MSVRVVAVFGYSRRRDKDLHRICAARLAHAQGLAADARAVVLSGMPEAELMQAAWAGSDVELICDPDARSTAQNAANVAAAAKALDADELVVVTSGWHRVRALLFLKLALRRSGIRLSVETASGPRPPLLLAREVVCLALVPFQLIRRSDPVKLRAASQSRIAGKRRNPQRPDRRHRAVEVRRKVRLALCERRRHEENRQDGRVPGKGDAGR